MESIADEGACLASQRMSDDDLLMLWWLLELD